MIQIKILYESYQGLTNKFMLTFDMLTFDMLTITIPH